VGTDPARLDRAGAVLNQELGVTLWAAVDQLPARQRQVLVLREVEGWAAGEVCDLLGLSNANQRILLHLAPRPAAALPERVEESSHLTVAETVSAGALRGHVAGPVRRRPSRQGGTPNRGQGT
jgi:hypothetical protein